MAMEMGMTTAIRLDTCATEIPERAVVSAITKRLLTNTIPKPIASQVHFCSKIVKGVTSDVVVIKPREMCIRDSLYY